MLDRFKREISYLRISVTDRCNLRCTYCMPEEGIELMNHGDLLSLEELAEVVKVGVEKFGIKKIRLTGGEPLVRRGIVNLVNLLNEIPGIEEINMTTNGIFLEKYAQELKDAGLTRVNISLDTLSTEKYKAITRGGDIEEVKKGIAAAKIAGLSPIKINAVKSKNPDLEDLNRLKEYCETEGLKLRFINQMTLNSGEFSQVEGGSSGNCKTCNRLRLMANGDIKPCLFDDHTYNVKEYGIEKAYWMALESKPEKGTGTDKHNFYSIGG